MSKLQATLTQHPVGQGGFMSGLLEIPSGRLHWAYDCGSNQTDALKREIAVVAARGDIDLLFLSHLDSDHVNGIDRLLMSAHVKEVVLPYLNDLDRLIAVAHEAAAGALTGGFLTFVTDVEGWFGARGVERITYITPRDDDGEGGDGPELPRGDEGGGEGPIEPKWIGQVAFWPKRRRSIGERTGAPTVQRLETGASVQMIAGYAPLDWVLVPYAHRPSNTRLMAFRRAMARKFGPNYRSQLRHLVGNVDLLREIRDCYDLIWSDHNLVSMALYSGPIAPNGWEGHGGICPRPYWHYINHSGAVGWLGTGDMHLDVRRRWNAFCGFYGQLLPQVNVLTLPHHGSAHNFAPQLTHVVSNASQFVAAAGRNSYGHPSEAVIRVVRASAKEFVQVSEKAKTVLEWRHEK